MQLTLEEKYLTYYPPKSQLLKWVGNKQKFAVEITRYFPTDIKRYIEPFLGSGAILATVAPSVGMGSDAFGPLVEIWKKLASDPNGLVEWYAERRRKIEHEKKEEVYKSVLSSYNNAPNGADFLFLTRSCYGGIVRFRKSDGYMSTPCGAHTPIPIENFATRVKEWKSRLKNVSFEHLDYKEAFAQAEKGDLIYCDPPYSHSQAILYGAQNFCLEELLAEIELVKSKGVRVALSIDGNKKSGDYICDLPIPDGLFKREIFIDCGQSMLKRFQLEGQTLENEVVYDRLLLTY
jgi:DNA adenine methylase